MVTPRFHILNREELIQERTLFPFIQHLTRVVTASGIIKKFSPVALEAAPREGWLVFRDEGFSGFALHTLGALPKSSSLQHSLAYVRNASAIVESLGGAPSLDLKLRVGECPPTSWRTYEVRGVVNTLWCSVSLPIPEIPLKLSRQEREVLVRVRITGWLEASEEIEKGRVLLCDDVEFSLPEVRVKGRGTCKGGDMTFEVSSCEGVDEQNIPGVRLDLGEIEMQLSDLVGLRPGSVINLGEVVLERCFVRLGATVLAEGRFTSTEGKLLLTIDSVI